MDARGSLKYESLKLIESVRSLILSGAVFTNISQDLSHILTLLEKERRAIEKGGEISDRILNLIIPVITSIELLPFNNNNKKEQDNVDALIEMYEFLDQLKSNLVLGVEGREPVSEVELQMLNLIDEEMQILQRKVLTLKGFLKEDTA